MVALQAACPTPVDFAKQGVAQYSWIYIITRNMNICKDWCHYSRYGCVWKWGMPLNGLNGNFSRHNEWTSMIIHWQIQMSISLLGLRQPPSAGPEFWHGVPRWFFTQMEQWLLKTCWLMFYKTSIYVGKPQSFGDIWGYDWEMVGLLMIVCIMVG